MPGNIEIAVTAEELVEKIQGDREMTRDEMLAALCDDRAIAQAAGLSGNYADARDAKAHEQVSEIAEDAYNRVTAGEFDDHFAQPAPEISATTISRNDDMEIEM